mmetsp:Transcript_88232/g.189361  ORF Transcript_88232/g.189361 Transcript_88232/m.189361 type:complete len:253 (+) Transcript_88232:514-1272(+)
MAEAPVAGTVVVLEAHVQVVHLRQAQLRCEARHGHLGQVRLQVQMMQSGPLRVCGGHAFVSRTNLGDPRVPRGLRGRWAHALILGKKLLAEPAGTEAPLVLRKQVPLRMSARIAHGVGLHQQVVTAIRQVARHHLEDHHAETPHVALLSEGALEHLRRHVARGAAYALAATPPRATSRAERGSLASFQFLLIKASDGDGRIVEDLGDAEVGEHHMQRLCELLHGLQLRSSNEEHIVALQVLVDDTGDIVGVD